MTTKNIERQWPLAAMVPVGVENIGADNGVDLQLPPGALLVDLKVLATTAFNSGTTATLTVGDGTTTFANAVDISTTGNKSVSNVPKYYPSGGKLSITLAQTGTDATAGEATVVATYVIRNRGNEVAE